MARPLRIDLPGWPMHVTQRGVNRCAIFLDDDDRHHYLRLLREACRVHAVALHAYVLMDNHVHLLLTTRRAGDRCRAMHSVGQRYVQAFNLRHRRVGTLWQGRFKACVVDTDTYLLTVMRYIELNPVRAAMVVSPEAHPWSSARAHLGLRGDPLLDEHAMYLALGTTPAARHAAWRSWLAHGVDEDALNAIRRHLTREAALGDERFRAMVEKTLNRAVRCLPRGRPPRGGGGDQSGPN
jgi:putative transposase